MKKERIDILLVERGLADSISMARAMIMSGVVLHDEFRVDKPSQILPIESVIRIKGAEARSKYVGRGGQKMEAALMSFHIRPNEYVCLDIGASTGGFTDCLLQHGAKHVTAIDVGTNQLVWSLRDDPRVQVRENTNARNLSVNDFDLPFDLAVMDVSFISATKIIPSIFPVLKENGNLIVLIKPQFEVEKGEVGKGGIVREPEQHQRVVASVNAFAETTGFFVCGVIDSPILGAEGNREFLALYAKRK